MRALTLRVIEAEGEGFTVAEKLDAFPTIEDALRDCPRRYEHTAAPRGMFAHDEWAREKRRTHRQVRCEGCGRYLVWIPKGGAGG